MSLIHARIVQGLNFFNFLPSVFVCVCFAFLIDSVCSLEGLCYVQIPGLGLVLSSFNPMESVSCVFFSWVVLDFFSFSVA